MKKFNPTMMEALADPLIIMGTHTRITRRDGRILRFVDLDEPSVIDGQTYFPNGSSERSAVRLKVGVGADTTEIKGVLSGEAIIREELLAGFYDYAELYVFMAFIGRADLAPMPLVYGVFGEMEVDLGQFKIQLNSIAHGFTHNIGVKTSPACRAVLGDEHCQVDLNRFRTDGHITKVIDSRTYQIDALNGSGAFFKGGEFMVTLGAALGQRGEIRNALNSNITLYVPLTIAPCAGDAVQLTRGCDRSRNTCKVVFNNLINFQGEPDLPGQDEILAPKISSNG